MVDCATPAILAASFEVVGVLDMPGHLRGACPQQRLHRVEQGGVDEWFVCAGIQRTFVAAHSRVVGVREQLVEAVERIEQTRAAEPRRRTRTRGTRPPTPLALTLA